MRIPFVKNKIIKYNGVRDGKEVTVHHINNDQIFFNASIVFDEQTNRNKLVIDALKQEELKQACVNELTRNDLIKLREFAQNAEPLFTQYLYVFTLRDHRITLLSMTIDKKSCGYEFTQEIAKKIGLIKEPYIWKGIYFDWKIGEVFTSNVFIQLS